MSLLITKSQYKPPIKLINNLYSIQQHFLSKTSVSLKQVKQIYIRDVAAFPKYTVKQPTSLKA